jgi:hypothetical protein
MSKTKFTSPAEYCAERGINLWTFRNWMRMRLVPYVQVRRRIFIIPEKVDQIIESFTRESRTSTQPSHAEFLKRTGEEAALR